MLITWWSDGHVMLDTIQIRWSSLTSTRLFWSKSKPSFCLFSVFKLKNKQWASASQAISQIRYSTRPAGATRFFVILPKTETPTSSPDDLMKSSSARKNRQGWFGFKILDSQINIGGYTLQPNHTLFFCLVGLTSRYYMNYHVKSNNSWKLAFCPRKLYKT